MRTGPASTEPARTEPARLEPIEPMVHRGSNGVKSVAAPPVETTRDKHMVPRTSDILQPPQSKPFEPGKNEPPGPATYEPVGCWRSLHFEPVRSELATLKPVEPVTSFGSQGYRIMEPA